MVAQHGTWNYVQGNSLVSVSGTGADASIFSFTMGDGPPWLTGGAFEQKGSIITTLVLVSPSDCLSLRERKERLIMNKCAMTDDDENEVRDLSLVFFMCEILFSKVREISFMW